MLQRKRSYSVPAAEIPQTVDKIKAIMANQLSRQARVEQADDVVCNNGDLEALYAQLQPLHENYLAFKKLPQY